MTRRDRKEWTLRRTACALVACGGFAVVASAGEPPVIKGSGDDRPARLASYQDKSKPAAEPAKPKPSTETVKSERTDIKTTERTVGSHDYKEVSSFFNIREANANVSAGETEFEFEFDWETGDGDDDYAAGVSLKYGLTDDLFAEIELIPVKLGDGGDQGAGDLALILFYQWWHEADGLPAFATWLEGRFPSGDGSSGVDGELHFNLTSTWAPGFRGHLEGFVKTANGAPGGEEEENRRDFQWGAGPGLDFEFSEQTIGVINYLNRSSEEYGGSNAQILELGVAHELAEGQHVKFAVDIGLDGHEETPDFGAKVQWSIEW